jgi:hypothetical protein
MIVHITRDDAGFVQALGHRVALHLGGEPELKRRVLGTLAQLDDPPDELRFERQQPGEPSAEAEREPAPPPAPPSYVPGSEKSPAQSAPAINSSAPTNTSAPVKRSHKRR